MVLRDLPSILLGFWNLNHLAKRSMLYFDRETSPILRGSSLRNVPRGRVADMA